MAEKKKYSMLVFSNPVEGYTDEEFAEWYAGQHFHDLLRIPGYTGGQLFKISDTQLGVPKDDQPHRYFVVWDFETEDMDAVAKDIAERMEDGRTKFSPVFDKIAGYTDNTWEPITKYVTSEEIKGLSPEEVLEATEINLDEL